MPDFTRPWAYVIPENQDPKVFGGYVPSVVFQGEAGHFPMLGSGPHAQPWVWGPTLQEAQAICDKVNHKMGVSPEDAKAIMDSSVEAQMTDGGHSRRRRAYEHGARD